MNYVRFAAQNSNEDQRKYFEILVENINEEY
jgi:hypothetical protein